MIIALAMVIACYSVLTYQRIKSGKWIYFMDDAVSKSPNKARPYLNRGKSYAKQGFFKAMYDYNKAIDITQLQRL